LKQSSEQNSYRVSDGEAVVATVSLQEIAKLLGLRRNSRKLRELFDNVRGGIDGPHTCVHAVHLLLKAEFERIGAEFNAGAVGSVLTVFWHAYSKVDGAIDIVGDAAQIERVTKDLRAKTRLADRLTARSSVHRYLYRAQSGLVRTALDRQSLCRTSFDPTAVIDLEAIARRVHQHLARPLVKLTLRQPKSARFAARQNVATRDTINASRLAA
jgi:hypothetical protein